MNFIIFLLSTSTASAYQAMAVQRISAILGENDLNCDNLHAKSTTLVLRKIAQVVCEDENRGSFNYGNHRILLVGVLVTALTSYFLFLSGGKKMEGEMDVGECVQEPCVYQTEGEAETRTPEPGVKIAQDMPSEEDAVTPIVPKLAMSEPVCVDEIPEAKQDLPKMEVSLVGQIDVLPEKEIEPEESDGKSEGVEAPGVEFAATGGVGEPAEPGSAEISAPGWTAARVEPKDKVNERKPMVFVGGVSASTTPIELVNELKSQGFNVTVLPRIRYGVSFGFCPDLVLSSEAEVAELLSRERVWVKDRWVDIRPYIPKEDAVPTPHASFFPEDCASDDSNVESRYISAEDLLAAPPNFAPASGTPPMLHRSPTGSFVPVQHPYVHVMPQFGYNPPFSPHVVNFPMFYSQHSPDMNLTFPTVQDSFEDSDSHSHSPVLSTAHPVQMAH